MSDTMRYFFEGDAKACADFAAALPPWWVPAEKENADVGILVRCKRIITTDELSGNSRPWKWINLHFGKLPNYRGVRPITRAMLNGDTHIVVTWHRVSFAVDAGPVLWEDAIPIGRLDAPELYRRALAVGKARLAYEATRLLDIPLGEPQQGRPCEVNRDLWKRAMAWEEGR